MKLIQLVDIVENEGCLSRKTSFLTFFLHFWRKSFLMANEILVRRHFKRRVKHQTVDWKVEGCNAHRSIGRICEQISIKNKFDRKFWLFRTLRLQTQERKSMLVVNKTFSGSGRVFMGTSMDVAGSYCKNWFSIWRKTELRFFLAFSVHEDFPP